MFAISLLILNLHWDYYDIKTSKDRKSNSFILIDKIVITNRISNLYINSNTLVFIEW